MADAVRVQIVEGVEGLSHHKSGLSLCQMLSLCDEEKQFSTITQSILTQKGDNMSDWLAGKSNLSEKVKLTR